MNAATLALILFAWTGQLDESVPKNHHDSRELVSNSNLTTMGARQILEAAVEEAQRRGTTGAFAVVDAGGSLLAFERLDKTFPAASRVAEGKAVTAAEFQRPTAVFEELINKGRTSMTALQGFTPLAGGVPVVFGGRVVGAIGVSGAASAAMDDELARHAAAALENGTRRPSCGSQVLHVPSTDVRSGFEKGAVLVDDQACGFAVHTSRRIAAGEAEVHADETDIIHVLSGSATMVTGGRVETPREIGPSETRGATIQGGTPRRLVAGDVLVVPAGVPHWFQEVEAPFLYYVVKVRTNRGRIS